MEENELHIRIILPSVNQVTSLKKKVLLYLAVWKNTCFCNDLISPYDLCPTALSRCFKSHHHQWLMAIYRISLMNIKLLLIHPVSHKSQKAKGKQTENVLSAPGPDSSDWMKVVFSFFPRWTYWIKNLLFDSTASLSVHFSYVNIETLWKGGQKQSLNPSFF